MYNQNDILRNIQSMNGEITSQIIKDLIDSHRQRHIKMKHMYDEYKGNVDIKKREFADVTKINRKSFNDFRGDIVDSSAGYLFGKPITYQIDGTEYSDSEYDFLKNQLEKFNLINNAEDLDSQTGKMAIICGYASRLLYIDKNGRERVCNIPPWETIFIQDGSVGEIQYALRYYSFSVMDKKGNKKDYTKIEWYDDKNITYYIGDGNTFELDTITEETSVVSHMFDYVPLIKFVNNDEELGDFEKAEENIDNYDRLLSDAQNEIEEFRLAYMIFEGVEIDEETIQLARQTGAFNIPDGSKVSFLTKQMAGEFIEAHKKTLNDNIYKFTKTVDMSDEKFSGGQQSGESRKWKLLSMENKCVVKERKFVTGLRTQFKVLASAWAKKNINLDYIDIFFQFTRNIPVELQLEADTNSKLWGTISDKTRLSLLSFVDDPDYEKEQMEEERGINLDSITLPETQEEEVEQGGD